MRRYISGWGTMLVALAGLLAAPLAGTQLPLLAASTALAVAVGAEAHARLHPRFGRLGGRLLEGYWIGPALTALAAALLAGRLDEPYSRAVPIIGALLVGVLLFAQDRELADSGGSEERWTPLAFALVLYLVAFVAFVLLYSQREPVWLAAPASGLAAALLAAAIFRPSGAPQRRSWLFALLIGLCVAELTAALGFWIPAGLLGGAFLLLYFYVAAGLIQALLDGTLNSRLAVEYGIVGLVGLALILSTSPWRP
jgi:hypothetical protein